MCYSCAAFQKSEEDGVSRGVILAIGLVLLTGCGNQGNKSSGVSVEPKWKGAPYRLTLDTKASKPNQAAITIPPVKYTANPDALETRAVLVMRFAGPAAPDTDPVNHLMIGLPVDVRGEQGSLPAGYLDQASKGLTDYVVAHCIQGNVKISLALARSSVKPLAQDAEVDAMRLSDWTPFETVFKKPHSKC
jgi:hypothetical protein